MYLLVALMSLVTTAPRTAAVAQFNGRPTIYINGEPTPPMIYALTDVPGGRWSWEELPHHTISTFAEQGFRLFQVDLFFDHIWLPDGHLDISMARKQIAGVIEACPEGSVFIRFHVTAPKWWMKAHSDQWVRYADVQPEEEREIGFPRIIEEDNYPVQRVSMASTLWKQEAGEKLNEFLHELSATPEGNALAGIQVANGVYGEWHNWGFFRNEPDVGGTMAEHFRDWARKKYKTVAALRKSWHNDGITFDTIQPPDMKARETTAGIFRDPAREQSVIDYYRCEHELVADNITSFARIVKESWPRPIIVGTFYGYYFSVFGRQAAGGHLALFRVLDSPFIDYLSGPQAYEPQALKLGTPYRSRSLITTIRLHRKLWLDEMDCEPETPVARDKNQDLHLRNSIAMVRRNTLFTLTKGMGLWFYDFGVAGVDLDGWRANNRGSRGTWDHPVVMAEIANLLDLERAQMKKPYTSGADVLFVFDTESFYYTASLRGTDPVSNTLIDYNTLSAFKSGVVFDPVHIGDLPRIGLSPYRVIVFGNCYKLTGEQRDFITKKVATAGRTIVWYYAPGYTDGVTLDAGRISSLTGITVVPIHLSTPPEITLSFPGTLRTQYAVGSLPVSPLFAVADAEAQSFGTYAGTSHVAVAKKEFPDHTAWYVALPNTDVEPLRSIFVQSGAHVYCEAGDIAYAGSGVLVIHTSSGGEHRVTLRNGKKLTFDLPEGANTLVLDPESGETLP